MKEKIKNIFNSIKEHLNKYLSELRSKNLELGRLKKKVGDKE